MKIPDIPPDVNMYAWVLTEAGIWREERRKRNQEVLVERRKAYIAERQPVWDALDARLTEAEELAIRKKPGRE